MATNSENVQNWRKRTKDRLFRAFGSKCACCNYDKCLEALQFHHLDPNTKEFTISTLTSDIRGWDKIVIEARKCVMLCANCHSEVHAGLRVVPTDAPRFDESFAEYRKTDFGEQSKCVVCGDLKPTSQNTCSYSCAGSKTGFDWSQYDLSELLKTHPSIASVARSIGVSHAAVTKRKKKLGL